MVKILIKFLIVIGILVGIGFLSYPPIAKAIAERNKPRWRTVKVERGIITQKVNATGTIRPVKSVQVGSFVSGPIENLYAEFNQEVKANELLAKIDARLIQSNVDRDRASLRTREADVLRVKAQLQQARNDEKRAYALHKKNSDFIAQAELDKVKFATISLEAQLTISEASVEQANATLTNSLANLAYTEIRSPEDGIIIDRKVEPGQTLAASFQTPELFVVGVGMREKMHVFADIDESEIGLIRNAENENQPVSFTVDAYPDDKFNGQIEEVRFSSKETQNVVTYPVVVGVPNPDLKLLPGMTANLSFQISVSEKVTKIPKAALRFYPPDSQHVHPDDRHILDGLGVFKNDSDKDNPEEISVDKRVEARQKAKKRHVWIIDGEFLRAIEIQVGLSDTRHIRLVAGDLAENVELVTGLKGRGE